MEKVVHGLAVGLGLVIGLVMVAYEWYQYKNVPPKYNAHGQPRRN